MCTVTYLPTTSDNFVLTSNRDEAPVRSAEKFEQLTKNSINIKFPKDKGAGGTWIAMSSSNRVVCLLNGAFIKHKHQPPYKRSRGLMVLQYFDYAKATDFFEQYDFKGMESFTFIIAEYGNLWEFRWDEKQAHILELDAKSNHLWASATLYDSAAQKKRQIWFEKWQKEAPSPITQHILDFHFNAGDGDPWNDLQMNRNGVVKTIGITKVEKKTTAIEMTYFDLMNKIDMLTNVHLDNIT